MQILCTLFSTWAFSAPILASATTENSASISKAVEFYAHIDAGSIAFTHQEFSNGLRLVKESGHLPETAFALGYRINDTDLAWQSSYAAGEVDYDGQRQNGSRIRSETDTKLFNTRFLLTHPLSEHFFAQTSFGYRHWQRDIQSRGSTSGLDETYRWWFAGAGIGAWYQLTPSQKLTFTSMLNMPFDAKLDVKFLSGLDDASLRPGRKSAVNTEVKWSIEVSNNLSVQSSLSYRYWRLGQSSAVPLRSGGTTIGRVSEPKGNTQVISLEAGLQYRF